MVSSQGEGQDHPANTELIMKIPCLSSWEVWHKPGSVISLRVWGRAAFLCHCKLCWWLPEAFVTAPSHVRLTNYVMPWQKSKHLADNFYPARFPNPVTGTCEIQFLTAPHTTLNNSLLSQSWGMRISFSSKSPLASFCFQLTSTSFKQMTSN